MKYAVIKVVNGNYFVHAEGITDLKSARVSYFGLCQSLWNEDDVITAEAMIVDENLARIGNYIEHIDKNDDSMFITIQ